MESKTVGIIGFGRFGSLVGKVLKKNFEQINIKVFDINPLASEKVKILTTFEKVGDCRVVIICVPISSFEKVIKSISNRVKPGALIIDVCSVKIHPVMIMKKFLPENVDIIATHPLFGPNSIENRISGKKIVIWNVRTSKKRFSEFQKICENLGLEIIIMPPKEHDRLIASTQGIAHLVGRIQKEMRVGSTKIDTPTFERLLDIQRIVNKDSLELFIDMNRFNPFAKDVRDKMRSSLNKIENSITACS